MAFLQGPVALFAPFLSVVSPRSQRHRNPRQREIHGEQQMSAHPRCQVDSDVTSMLLQVVSIFDQNPNLRQEDVAKTLGLKNRSDVASILQKARVIQKNNPEWFRTMFLGRMPEIPPLVLPKTMTEEEEDIILECRAEGMSMSKIAEKLKNRTRYWVCDMVVQLRNNGHDVGAPLPPRVTQEEKDAIVKMKAQGMSQRAIADQMRRSEGVVSTILKSFQESHF